MSSSLASQTPFPLPTPTALPCLALTAVVTLRQTHISSCHTSSLTHIWVVSYSFICHTVPLLQPLRIRSDLNSFKTHHQRLPLAAIPSNTRATTSPNHTHTYHPFDPLSLRQHQTLYTELVITPSIDISGPVTPRAFVVISALSLPLLSSLCRPSSCIVTVVYRVMRARRPSS